MDYITSDKTQRFMAPPENIIPLFEKRGVLLNLSQRVALHSLYGLLLYTP